MGIIVHEAAGVFHLCNDRISYLMKRMANGQMGQLYFGRRICDREDFPHLLELAHRDMAPCVFPGDTTFSLEHIKQEYPAFGTGDMRYPAYEICRENGSRISSFCYRGFRVYPGKPALYGLPAVYVEKQEEASTLEIELEDPVIGGKLILLYTIFEKLPVIVRSARFENVQETPWELIRAMSISLDLPDCRYEMLDLAGASLRERYR